MDASPSPDALSPELTRQVDAARAAGRQLGRYLLLEPLGAGAMGTVFRAFDPALRRLVAVKLLGATGPRADRARARFRREAQAVAKLRHESIVPIHDVGSSSQDRPFIVMDLIAGASLRARLDGGRLDRASIARIGARVARALHHAHGQGIVHRDVKPENILIDEAGEPHLADFGLALDLTRDGRLTQENEVVGTVLYMAPEQVTGEAPISPATDIWALGAILHEALIGRPAFRGDSAMAVISAIIRHRSYDAPDGVPAAWVTLLGRCLTKDPADRFPDAEALATALEGLATERRPRAAAIALGAALLAATAAAGLAATRGGPAPTPTGAATDVAVGARLAIELAEPADGLVTAADRVAVRGRVAGPPDAPALVMVASERVELDADRAFAVEVALVDGPNEIDVVLAGGGFIRLEIIRDREPPRLAFDPVPRLAAWPAKPNVVIVGTLDEDGCELRCDGAEVSIEGRSFRAERPLDRPGRNPIAIEAIDPAGNATRWEADAILLDREPERPIIPEGTWWAPSFEQVRFAIDAGAPLWFRNEVGVRMVLIPPGSFVPLDAAGASRPRITIADGFYVAATETTNAELRAFDPAYRARPLPPHVTTADEDDRPANEISRARARAFAAWLGERHGVPGAYRLPTSAEWELAARAGSTGSLPWEDGATIAERANTGGLDGAGGADGFEHASPVGSFPPNRFGLFDVIGNAWEWVDDGDDASSARGGSWFGPARKAHLAERHSGQLQSATTGFRVAASLGAAPR